MSCHCRKGSGSSAGRVGFVIDACLPSLRTCLQRRTIRPLLTGWPSTTPGTVMRFGWIARHVNQLPDRPWVYELYRPWRTYRAVVFIKSMDDACRRFAVDLRRKGVGSVFDANVDYFTPASGTSYYDGMAPTSQQREQSCDMARICDGVIADSRHLLGKVLPYNPRAVWIPDNVPDAWIAQKGAWRYHPGDKLILLWSGEAVKLFELLRIEPVLRRLKNQVRLRLITGNLAALSRIHEPWQGRLRRLLTDLACEILPFQNIESLLSIYDQGGVCISPRFLDNTYNLGHTEWKISLAMARGRVAIASPQQSYCDIRDRAGGKGVRICAEEAQWDTILDSMLGGGFDWEEEQRRACAVVQQYYATSVVAASHVAWLASVISDRQAGAS